jgi:hypothetical protein
MVQTHPHQHHLWDCPDAVHPRHAQTDQGVTMSIEDQIKFLREVLATQDLIIRLSLDQHIAIETTVYRLELMLVAQE